MIDEERLRSRLQRAIGYVQPSPAFATQRVSALIADSSARGGDRQRNSTLMAVVAAALAAAIAISLVLAAHNLHTKPIVPAEPKPIHIAVCDGQCQVNTLPALSPLAGQPSPSALVNCSNGCDVTPFFGTPQIGWISES